MHKFPIAIFFCFIVPTTRAATTTEGKYCYMLNALSICCNEYSNGPTVEVPTNITSNIYEEYQRQTIPGDLAWNRTRDIWLKRRACLVNGSKTGLHRLVYNNNALYHH